MNNDMNNDLISRADLLKKVICHTYPVDILENEHKVITEVLRLIGNAPSVTPSLNLNNITEEDIEKFKTIFQRAHSKGLLTILEERTQDEWIPITFRQADDEEYKDFIERHDYIHMSREECKVYDCQMPYDGQEVLVTTCGGYVCEDVFCADPDYYGFENCSDPDDAIAWMPKPRAYKKGGKA